MYNHFSPTFQIPYEPLYEATRFEIERSISTLEDKFRRRKDIDLQLKARSYTPNPLPEYLMHNYQHIRREEEALLLAKMEQQANIRRQLENDQIQLQRIELLKKQRDILQRQNEYKRSIYATPYGLGHNYEQNADDQELIKRYEDGSKAKEYYKDIELQKQRVNSDHKIAPRPHRQQSNTIQKSIPEIPLQSNIKSHLHSQRKNNVYETPYEMIRERGKTFKKEEGKQLAQELRKQFDKIQQEKQIEQNQKWSKTLNKDHSPFRLLEESKKGNKTASPNKPLNKYQSLGKFAAYRSRSSLSPMRKSYENSYLESRRAKVQEVKPSMKQIEISALKKIENRLKVSKVIFQDSQFRNIKYEQNHLFNTFDIESKLRKEAKEKLNNHPWVLKKHALVC